MGLSTILTIASLIGIVVLLYMIDQHGFLGSYWTRVLRLSGVYAISALSMNLVNGFTGQFSLGHAGFMAIGAYVTSLLIIPTPNKAIQYYVTPVLDFVGKMHAPFWLALILGGLLAAIAAFFIGFPVLRLKGDYLAIATLGFSEIIRIFITNLIPITNGPMGLKNIPASANIWWTTGICTLTVVFMLRLMDTSYGRAIKAIRDDETAAEAMGISLFRHKMMAFMMGAFFAGVSGGLIASVVGTINPGFFRFTLAYEILLIVVLGGLGSITGSVVGAFVLTISREWLRFLDNGFSILGIIKVPPIAGMRMLFFSVLLMIVILYSRRGLFGSNEFTWAGLFAFPGKWKNKAANLFDSAKQKAGRKK